MADSESKVASYLGSIAAKRATNETLLKSKTAASLLRTNDCSRSDKRLKLLQTDTSKPIRSFLDKSLVAQTPISLANSAMYKTQNQSLASKLSTSKKELGGIPASIISKFQRNGTYERPGMSQLHLSRDANTSKEHETADLNSQLSRKVESLLQGFVERNKNNPKAAAVIFESLGRQESKQPNNQSYYLPSSLSRANLSQPRLETVFSSRAFKNPDVSRIRPETNPPSEPFPLQTIKPDAPQTTETVIKKSRVCEDPIIGKVWSTAEKGYVKATKLAYNSSGEKPKPLRSDRNKEQLAQPKLEQQKSSDSYRGIGEKWSRLNSEIRKIGRETKSENRAVHALMDILRDSNYNDTLVMQVVTDLVRTKLSCLAQLPQKCSAGEGADQLGLLSKPVVVSTDTQPLSSPDCWSERSLQKSTFRERAAIDNEEENMKSNRENLPPDVIESIVQSTSSDGVESDITRPINKGSSISVVSNGD